MDSGPPVFPWDHLTIRARLVYDLRATDRVHHRIMWHTAMWKRGTIPGILYAKDFKPLQAHLETHRWRRTYETVISRWLLKQDSGWFSRPEPAALPKSRKRRFLRQLP